MLAAAHKNPEEILDLPYAIKGNDVSYSGLLSAAKDLFNEGYSKESVSYSVQEFSFSILTEATERALAFTDKQELTCHGWCSSKSEACGNASEDVRLKGREAWRN